MRYFFAIICSYFFLVASAFSATGGFRPLITDQAFQVTATAKDQQTILVTWQIAPGYYLYKDRIRFRMIKSADKVLLQPIFSKASISKSIPGLGHVDVFQQSVTAIIPLRDVKQSTLSIAIYYQGCSDQGVCYAPQKKRLTVLMKSREKTVKISKSSLSVSEMHQQTQKKPTESAFLLDVFQHENTIIIILIFLLVGMLLSLTPCVLPMIPVLSAIILGRSKISHRRAFLLTLLYVMGMALTYAIAGSLFSVVGSSVQAFFQAPWVIVVFSVLLVLMALSLFGFYSIQLPEKLRHKILYISDHQKRGSPTGVFIMGVCSTLILSPCVTPPLVAVLSYVGHSGNVFFGFIALLAIGFGMGVPLLLIGAFGPKYLPRTGALTQFMKPLLGLLILAVVVSMLERIVSADISLILWVSLIVSAAVFIAFFISLQGFKRLLQFMIAATLFIYGLLLLANAYLGVPRLLPLSHLFYQKNNDTVVQFIPVRTVADIQAQLSLPEHYNKPAIVDFYADWCFACKDMDRHLFSNKQVKQVLQKYVVLRADVTQNSEPLRRLQQAYGVIAPPTILVFDRHHHEIRAARMVGVQSVKGFLSQLQYYLPHSSTPLK